MRRLLGVLEGKDYLFSMLNNKLDLTNQIYRDILVLGSLPSKNNKTLWEAKCLLCEKIFEVSTVSLRHWKKSNCGSHIRDEKNYKKYSVNDNYFESINHENSYWAGFIAADGCINNTHPRLHLELSVKDLDHLLLFKKTVNYTGIVETRNRKNNIMVKLQISSRKWKEDLQKNFNIVPKKSLILHPPNLTDTYLDSYVAGLIDGDGCLRYTNDKYKYPVLNIVTGSKNMALFLQNYFLEKENIILAIHVPKIKTSKTHTLTFCGKKVDHFKNYIKTLYLPLLQRKWKNTEEAS